MRANPEIAVEDMTPDQRECYALFCDLVFGEHHLHGKVKGCGAGLLWNARIHNLATFDFDGLTRLVVLSHDRCIRTEIIPSGPGMIGITAYKRHKREGSMYERHPTMEESIVRLRPSPTPQVLLHKEKP